MWGHDSLRGRGPRPVHVPVPVSLALPLSVSFAGGATLLLPLPVVRRRLVAYCGGFALVLAGVLMQDIQGFGIRCRFGDSGAGAGFVAALVSPGYFTGVRWERVAPSQVGACDGRRDERLKSPWLTMLDKCDMRDDRLILVFAPVRINIRCYWFFATLTSGRKRVTLARCTQHDLNDPITFCLSEQVGFRSTSYEDINYSDMCHWDQIFSRTALVLQCLQSQITVCGSNSSKPKAKSHWRHIIGSLQIYQESHHHCNCKMAFHLSHA